ncbi:MAG: PKD domain-containing protein [Nitrospirota bacterium]
MNGKGLICSVFIFFVLALGCFSYAQVSSVEGGNKQHLGSADAGPHIVTYVGIETKFKGIATSPDREITKYVWDFDGDGVNDYESSTTGFAVYTFKKAGNYTAVFKAYDDSGSELPTSTTKVIVRKGKGKTEYIPIMQIHRSNLDKIKKQKAFLKENLGLTSDEETFLELQDSIPESTPSANMLSADGIRKRHIIMFNGGYETRFWDDVLYAYDMFHNVYGIPEADIYLLNYDGLNPDKQNPDNMIDYPAEKSYLQTVCNNLANTVDSDDLLYVWVTDHGRGYRGPVQHTSDQQSVYGYLDGVASVDSGDEEDYLESNFKLRSFYNGGFYNGNYGMEVWKVYYSYKSSTETYFYRHKYVSHFDNIYFNDLGIQSDSDIYIEYFKDYLEGDFNKDGVINTALGEVADYDGDRVSPYNGLTGTFDEDDWGEIDKYTDDILRINTGVPMAFIIHIG